MKIVILHGWTYEPENTWGVLLSILKRRGMDFEALRVPGLSDGTDPVWTLDDYVEWLRGKVGAERVILWGHSNGGRISLAFAARYPGKVARLILEDSAGIPPSGFRKLKRDVFRVVAKLGSTITGSQRVRELLYKIIRENDYRRATPNMKKTMANLVAFDARAILAKIVAPTLIIWGEYDRTTPRSAAHVIHSGIRGSSVVIIRGARHSPHITHPQEVAQMISDFISL